MKPKRKIDFLSAVERAKQRPLRIRYNRKKSKFYITDGNNVYWFTKDPRKRGKEKKLYDYIKTRTVEKFRKSYRRSRRRRSQKKAPTGNAFQSPTVATSALGPISRPTDINFKLNFPGNLAEVMKIMRPIELPEAKKALAEVKQPLAIENKQPLAIEAKEAIEEKKVEAPKLIEPKKVNLPEGVEPLDEEEFEKAVLNPSPPSTPVRMPAIELKTPEKIPFQRNPYYVKYFYLDEAGNETSNIDPVKLEFATSELNKKGTVALYKQILKNEEKKDPTEINTKAGLNFFVPKIRAVDPVAAKKEITRVELVTEAQIRHLLPKGSGKKERWGLYDSEINKKMGHWNHFIGTIMRDELPEVLEEAAKNRYEKFGLILNTQAAHEGNGKHWVALYVDLLNDKEICYFDSFGDPPHNEVEEAIKNYVDRLKLPYMLRFKVNSNQLQDNDSSTCGAHAMNFLEDMFTGESFGNATGYEQKKNLIQESEKRAAKVKTEAIELSGGGFPYI